MKVLVCLVAHAPETVTRQDLLEQGWEEADYVADEALTKAISTLRKVLRHQGCFDEVIRTVPKMGYRLVVLPHFQEASMAIIREAQGPDRLTLRAKPTARVLPSVRQKTLASLVVVGMCLLMIGLGFFFGAADTSEPQVRVVRRALHYDPLTQQTVPLPARSLDTLYVGDEALRLRNSLDELLPNAVRVEIKEDS